MMKKVDQTITVDDTVENLQICKKYCGACPTCKGSRLSESPPNALFCARGKSSVSPKVKTIKCFCPACEVFMKNKLIIGYFCAQWWSSGLIFFRLPVQGISTWHEMIDTLFYKITSPFKNSPLRMRKLKKKVSHQEPAQSCRNSGGGELCDNLFCPELGPDLLEKVFSNLTWPHEIRVDFWRDP